MNLFICTLYIIWTVVGRPADRVSGSACPKVGALGIASDDPTGLTRLLHEARAAAPLNHPHICTIYEVGEINQTPFITMELVGGETLQTMVARGPLAVPRVCRLGRQLADALEHAHSRGVIHRDFKSANVIVTTEGRAKVLDFGIARRVSQAETARRSPSWPGASCRCPTRLTGSG